MVDEDPATDRRTWMNFNAGQHAAEVRDHTPKPIKLRVPQTMCELVCHDGMQARIASQDFQLAACGRISFENAGDVFAQRVKHDGQILAQISPRDAISPFNAKGCRA